MNQPAPAPAPDPGSKHEMPGYQPPVKDPRLDWLFKGIGAIALAGIIGLTGWIFGGLYERLDKAEDEIEQIKLNAVKEHTGTKAKLDVLDASTKKQWELISENGRGIAALRGQ